MVGDFKIYFLNYIFLFWVGFSFASDDKKVATIEKDFWQNFHLKIDYGKLRTFQIQTLTHYFHPGLQDNLINTFELKQKFKMIGVPVIESIVNKAICREEDFASTHYVFYHGCKIEFLVFQDILKFLYKALTKKNIKEFVFLRNPSTFFEQYESVQTFLNASNYCIYDSLDPDRKLLLSVNPSLFGNSIYRTTSSAFCYFLNSDNAVKIDLLDCIKDIFESYNLVNLFYKYKNQIQDCFDVLTKPESAKTGILVQIFVPKDCADLILYRSLPKGVPFYSKDDPELLAPSVELKFYQKNLYLIKKCSSSYIDTMQFRILLNRDIMLNPNGKKSAKIFRYLNKTPKVKEYKAMFKNMTESLLQDLSK